MRRERRRGGVEATASAGRVGVGVGNVAFLATVVKIAWSVLEGVQPGQENRLQYLGLRDGDETHQITTTPLCAPCSLSTPSALRVLYALRYQAC